MPRLSRYVLLLVFMAWAGVAYAAQSAQATFSGRLLDEHGMAIAGLNQQNLNVTMKSAATGEVHRIPVDAKGGFRAQLPAGTYDFNVPIVSAMYVTVEQKGLALKAGETLNRDVTLPFGFNLGTIGDDPVMLMNDLRARSSFTEGPTPRMPDGKPDLSGIWSNIAAAARPQPPMNAWALDIQAQMRKIHEGEPGGPGAQLPQAYCLPQSATPTTLNFPYKFIQTPTVIVQLTEFLTEGWRQIFMNAEHPPADEWNPSWYGHSTGRWEGDTLVIDTVGFNESTPGYGVHTEKLHVIERITRTSVGKMSLEIWAEDPDAWTGPYSFKWEAGLVTGQEIREFICPENNKDALHFGGLGWRARP